MYSLQLGANTVLAIPDNQPTMLFVGYYFAKEIILPSLPENTYRR